MKNDITAVILCAGSGKRSSLNKNKILYNILNIPIYIKTLSAFLSRQEIDNIILMTNKDDYEAIKQKVLQLHTDTPIAIYIGGATRSDSVKIALSHTKTKYILIHDGARCFVSQDVITRAIASLNGNDATSAYVSPKDTIAVIKENALDKSLNRNNLAIIQTPQCFKTSLLNKAFSVMKKNETFTDETSLYKKYIGDVAFYAGDYENIKITTPQDFNMFTPLDYRVGIGFDIHKLVEKRPLILGGIKIEYEKGLLGHSDADVLTHAIMDAILSAVSEKDIGQLFPDNDPKYKNISSIKLLEKVLDLVNKNSFSINNISAVIMAERPKLAKTIPFIQENLAKTLKINKNLITISATTMEKLGPIGSSNAIACQACVLMHKK